MKTTIDSAGRLVIPKDVRRQAGLHPGDELEVRWRDGRIEIEPVMIPVRLEWQDGWLVAVPEVDVPPLTEDIVNATLKALHRERGETPG
jgi:AbrB family looped-hinge helix DNA binding protein